MILPMSYKLLAQAEISLSGNMQEVDGHLDFMYDAMQIKYPKYYKMNLLCKLGFLTAEKLFFDNPLLLNDFPEAVKCSTILFNAASSATADIIHATSVDDPQVIPGPGVFVYTLPNILNGELCIRHGWTGYNAFFVINDHMHKNEEMAELLQVALSGQEINLCLTGWVETDLKNELFKGSLALIAKK